MKKPSGPVRARYRLSPNEVEQLKKEETERRRKLRILQVREQAKTVAAKIRNDVKQEKERQLLKLAKQVEEELQNEKEEEVRRLEKQYENTLRTVGQGHLQAKITDESICHTQQLQAVLENKKKAEYRHQEALRKLTVEKAYKEYEETKHVRDRHAALEQEKKRAAEVAARPPPPPDVVSEVVGEAHKPSRPIPLTDLNAFSATHYHIPEFAVERAPKEQQHDGKLAGEGEDERLKEELEEKAKREHDQLIRARIRGNEALKKEMLKHEYDALVADLSLQQRLDRRRRQGVVAKIPKQVFLPPDRCLEEKEDKQLEMERAFEDMYMQQINMTGDLSLTLDPVPESTQNGESTATNDSSPMIMPTLPPLNPALRELTNVSRGQGQTSQEGKPETSLKRLLNKIKEQQSEAKQSRAQQAASGHVGEKPSEDKHRSAFRQVPAGKGHPAPSSARPDPQLDLSPLKSQTNKRPDKQEVQGEVPPQQPQPPTLNRLDGDAGDGMFLERLKERLQAIEVQNSYLDKKIKDQQKMKQHFENQVPETTAPSSLPQQHQVTATGQPLISRHAAVPQTKSDDNIGVQPAGHSAAISVGATSSQGKPRDGVPILSKPVLETKPAKQGVATKEEQLPFTGGTGLPPSTLQSQRLAELSVGAKYTPLSTGTETAHPEVRSMPRFSASVAGLPSAGFTAFSGGYMPGMSTVYARQAVFGTNYSSVPSTEGLAVSVAQAQTLSTVPSVSLGQSQSLSAGGDLNPAGCLASRFGTVTSARSLAGFPSSAASLTSQIPGRIYQPTTLLSASTVPSALPLSHLTGRMYPPAATSVPSNPIFPPPVSSQLAGRMYEPLAESLSSAQIVGDHTLTLLDGGDETSVSKSGRPENLMGTLGSLLASGFREQENIQRIREYQRQLAEKHAERMKSLSEMRVRIEGAQRSRVESKTLLAGVSGLGQLPDPSVLAPYTLHTLSGQPSRFLATLPSSAASRMDAPKSSTFVGFTQASSTDATSSAQGDLLNHHSDAARVTIHGMADREDVTLGIVTSKSLSSAGKLDSVRKSLPFESPDKSQVNDDDAGDDAGDASMANDSHLSSSTERGSPVLAGHSKHAGSRSTDSDRSVGASSLIAHAEEKRLNFEHRTKELQDQLEEIQRKKEELLRRYHDNQPWTSAQKENVYGKPQESEATARTSERSAPISAGDASAISATVHVPQQAPAAPAAASWAWDGTHATASASLELEERSFSSDCLSRPGSQRSWANILEDYSSQDRNQTQTSFKSPDSMTLEEVSFASDTSVAKKVGENGLSGSSTSLLQEKSIVTGNREISFGSLSLELEEELLSVRSNHDGLNTWPHSVNQDRSSLSRVLLPDVGSTQIGLATQPRSHLLTPKESGSAMEASASPACLPPPPSRLPVLPVIDYQPHELSTIIEVDTPQTASKSLHVMEMTPTLPLVPGVTLASGASVGTGARRCIDFSKRGSAAEDDKPPESRFSASGGSGSSGSSGRHTVVEVFHHIPLHSSDLLVNLRRSSADMNENFHCREPEFTTKNNPSSQDQNLTGQGSGLLQATADISSLSSGQELFPLDLTSLSSPSAEESQVRQLLDFSDADSRPQPGSLGDEHSQAVLRNARQFNPELMAAIQLHADNVFDQSSLMSLSHYTDESVSSRT